MKIIPNLHDSRFTIHDSRSFTLIEILVASAIFTAVVVLAIGSFTGSINYQGSSTEDRITRQSIVNFNDWMTRQIRSVASLGVDIPVNSHCLKNDLDTVNDCVAATDNYHGFGFLLFEGFAANKYRVIYPATNYGVKNLILPKSGGGWIYISGKGCSVDDALPVIRTSVSTSTAFETRDPCSNGNNAWANQGQILSSEVIVSDLTFFGVNPSSLFNANVTGSDFPALSQPYITWRMKIAPASDPTNVSSFQTTITSRDYSYIYPSINN